MRTFFCIVQDQYVLFTLNFLVNIVCPNDIGVIGCDFTCFVVVLAIGFRCNRQNHIQPAECFTVHEKYRI